MLNKDEILKALNEDISDNEKTVAGNNDEVLQSVTALSESLNTLSAKFDAEMSKIHDSYFTTENKEENEEDESEEDEE